MKEQGIYSYSQLYSDPHVTKPTCSEPQMKEPTYDDPDANIFTGKTIKGEEPRFNNPNLKGMNHHLAKLI